MKILVIEDEKLLADSLETLLESKGFTVEVAYDGETGEQYAELGIYDLLILDVMMPKMDGYQVARQVRAKRCTTPILMLTAKSNTEDRICTNLDTNVTSSEYNASSSNVVVKDIYGIEITVASGLTGVTEGDIVDVEIIGDSTYIVPGTILGRIKDSESDNFGKFEPIGSDLTKYDILRVCGGTIETNKQNFVAPVSDVTNNADNYTVDVYVFAQVIEEACRAINLTDDAKKRIEGIVWE